MACVISAPSSGSGKTLLSILLSSWAKTHKLKLQSFKVGPDYLDPQILSVISGKPCRNLDLILSGKNWLKNSFHGYGSDSDLTLIEGVMGLFDGIGSSSNGSTAAVAKELCLPVILVVNASGQAASLGALITGFKNKDPQINLAGVVINRVSSKRHKALLEEVLSSIGIKMLGCLPKEEDLRIESSHLGIAPQHEIKNLNMRISQWSEIAERTLNIDEFLTLMKPPSFSENPIKNILKQEKKLYISNANVAIAADEAFHFRYPETQEILEQIGINIIEWSPLKDELIPKNIGGLILPGGFPELHAEQISSSKKSISSLRDHYGKIPIYAECGGMILLGESINDLNGKNHSMAGILPFRAEEGSLQVGYRKIVGIKDSLLIKKGDQLNGHEYHRWKLLNVSRSNIKKLNEARLNPPWKVSGWNIHQKEEGWSNEMLHASWIHLHWPSNINIIKRWKDSINNNRSNQFLIKESN